jgi:GT2 family glycosyltransferase
MKESSRTEMTLRISVIITSYTLDRLNDIRELLDGISVQTYPVFETIFVAERDQALAEGVREHALRTGLHVKIMFNEGEPGLSQARNLGAAVANGDVFGFVDDDTVLFKEWAAEVVQTFQDPRVIGVTGPVEPLWEVVPVTWLPEEFHWLLSCTSWAKWNLPKEVRNAWGMNMAFRREAFAGGRVFSPRFGLRNGGRPPWLDPPSEDVDFSIRVRRASGKRVLFNPRVRVRHRVHGYRLSLKFIAHRAASVGYQRRMMWRFYPPTPGERPLDAETNLLRRILIHLLPSTLALGVHHPLLAARRLFITVYIMVFVTAGYLWPPRDKDAAMHEPK